MSAERYRGSGEKKSKLRGVGLVVAAGLVSGVAGVAGITWRQHREQTHRSLEISKPLQEVIDFEQRTLGVGEPTVWASVHQIHHQMTDVSLFSFYKISHAIDEAEDRGIPVPENFKYLDPFVDKFTKEEVKNIGRSADRQIRQRLGDEYKPSTFKDDKEIEALLNPQKPTYFYEKYKKHKGEWTQDEIAKVFLTDPHSPALIDRENGVHGVALRNVGLYVHAANLFRDRPDLKPEYLQKEGGGNSDSTKADIAAGFAIPAAAVLFARRKYKPKDFAIAALAGGVMYGVRAATEIFGGNVTNSMGHAGVLDLSRITQAGFSKKYKFKLNEDGSLATDTVHAGFLGRVLSVATLDEVGGQQVHHAHPERIAYTLEEGRKAWGRAPWGKLSEKLADSRLPFVKRGKGFDVKKGERRPDMPHEAVDLIQAARVKQMRATS
jgi:hypothetical protein